MSEYGLVTIEDTNNTCGAHFFLTVDGVPVTYVMVDSSTGVPVLELIETRDIFRGYGYAKVAMSMISSRYNVSRLSSSGVFTDAGNKYIRNLLDGSERRTEPISGTGLGFDRFVSDWDNMVPVFK